MGLTKEQIHQPLVGRRDLLERGRALQHLADAPGAGGEEGRGVSGRHAARILHHHGDGRYRDGACRHARLASVARGDRRFRSS
jgi:hypothetical protein